MNKLKLLSAALFVTVAANAQDFSPVVKAIDAEKYENAKSLLKAIQSSNPNSGKAAFLLGNIYLKQDFQDSAKVAFNKGLAAADLGKLNNIGLGQLDLNSGNASGAKAKFDEVIKAAKKKEVLEYVYVARAYLNADKPDYKAAIAVLTKAKEINPTDAQVLLALGDAYYGDKNQNDAYVAYRSAYATDSSLLRAKMQQGVLLKGAKAYTEATKAFDEVLGINANYGPVYRELAETYYYWANNQPKDYEAYIKKSLEYYEQYMKLTDYSLASRMRHADFLILAEDYKALEVEANEMKKLDKVNPRIYRYLGYSAYENGNFDAAISALNDYMTKGTKITAGDHYYLGLAKIAKAVAADGKVADASLFEAGTQSLKTGITMEPYTANSLNKIGKKYFADKKYAAASAIFEQAITNPESKNYLEDNLYYGLTVYTLNRNKESKDQNKAAIEKGDMAIDTVIKLSPDYQESYLYKARLNSLLGKDDIEAASYQKYVEIVEPKGTEELTRNKSKVTEAYNTLGAFYGNTDKAKAKEYLNKTLAVDPTNSYATETLKKLK